MSCFWKTERRKETPAREGQTNRASVWGIGIQIHTVASKVQHGNYHKQWELLSLNYVQNFFLTFLFSPCLSIQTHFSVQKKKIKNKKFGRISMRGPACTKETGDIYLLLQPTSSVYTGGTLVCLGIPGSKQYHCIRHALCCFSFVSFNMLSPLLYNFLWSSDFHLQILKLNFVFLFKKKKSSKALCYISQCIWNMSLIYFLTLRQKVNLSIIE